MLNSLNEIKKDFYSLRNGIVAESLKKIYPEGKIIYGLNVPQLMNLTQKYPKDLSLGLNLWKDKKCRESRLLSLYLIPPSLLGKEMAKEMILDVESTEEADFLAFKLLRNLPYAKELYDEIINADITAPLSSYCVKMFKKNLDSVSD